MVHAIAPGRVGGLESVVRALALGQHQRGYLVRVCSVIPPGEEQLPIHQALEAGGVEVIRVVISGRRYRQELQTLRARFEQLKPDLVHTHGYRSDLVAGRAARTSSIRRVSTVHGFTGGDWKNRLYEWLQVREFRQFDAVVAVSRPLVGRLTSMGVPSVLIHCIPNAWRAGEPALDRRAARQLLDLPQDAFVVGWVGRLSREKGADVLLEAIPRVPNSGIIFSFLGDGGERSGLEADAARLAVEDRVRWHGTVIDAGRLYSAFDLFVLSSRTEGTPVALFEAMAAGVPVVSTAVGGIPDVVGEREAVLVPPEDPVSLAQAIVALKADESRQRSLAAAARARLAERYDLPAWLDRYASLYDSLLVMR